MICVKPEASYLMWQADVQFLEEQKPDVRKTISAKVAEVASRMKDSGTLWGVVTIAPPYTMGPSGQVPVKIFTAKKGADFISEIPVEVFVNEKGSCLKDGDIFPFVFHDKKMELTVCNAYRQLFPTFKAHMTTVIEHSVHGCGFPPKRANDLLEGTPYLGSSVECSGSDNL
ncbi:MAG: hypothetical protein H0X29_07915 [Parachlamydiaceae bacterium]|nr:hypothetical protein [Parachlamydiaceae bacterium]